MVLLEVRSLCVEHSAYLYALQLCTQSVHAPVQTGCLRTPVKSLGNFHFFLILLLYFVYSLFLLPRSTVHLSEAFILANFIGIPALSFYQLGVLSLFFEKFLIWFPLVITWRFVSVFSQFCIFFLLFSQKNFPLIRRGALNCVWVLIAFECFYFLIFGTLTQFSRLALDWFLDYIRIVLCLRILLHRSHLHN